MEGLCLDETARVLIEESVLQHNTMKFIDGLGEQDQRKRARAFYETMLLEQSTEEARQQQLNPEHGKLTIEDRILLTTSKNESLEAIKRGLGMAGMADTTDRGRDRGGKTWDVDRDTDGGGRRGREQSRREKPAYVAEGRRREKKEERSRSREREQPREESNRRGRQQSPDRDRYRDRKPPSEKEPKGRPMSDDEINKIVDSLPAPLEGNCETCRGRCFKRMCPLHAAAGNHPNANPNGHKGDATFVSWQDWKTSKDLFDEPLKLGKYGTKDRKFYKVKQIELELYQKAIKNNHKKNERGGEPRSHERNADSRRDSKRND